MESETKTEKLTADEVRTARFPKAPIGRRGYAEDAVDSFLDRVEAHLRSSAVTSSPTSDPAIVSEDAEALKLLKLARETSDKLLQDTHAEMEALKEKATKEAAEVKETAEAECAATIARAEEEAHAKITAAEEASEATVSKARRLAERIEEEISQRREKELGQLEKQRQQLQRQISTLRTIEKDTITRIEWCLKRQSEHLAEYRDYAAYTDLGGEPESAHDAEEKNPVSLFGKDTAQA